MEMMKKYKLKITERNTNFKSVEIMSSHDSEEAIRKFYHDDIEIYESFFMLTLDRANKTTGYVKISQGGVAGTVVDIKIIAKYALDLLSCSVILAHNHPSGNLPPSEQDKAIIKRVKEGLKLLDINVLDNIILTADGYYSFADEGLM